ncbi:MAG: aldehyde dehydrogenase family protein [Micrococcus sp.]|nr:aldehyde dehydrogenase family protein [Micrococcus sp.]
MSAETSDSSTLSTQAAGGSPLTMDSLIAGRRRLSARYLHTIHADDLLTDSFTWIRRKRALDRGLAEPTPEDAALVGRTAVADPAVVDEAVREGRRAAKEWGAAPVATRKEFLDRARLSLQAHREEIVRVLVAEGHPRRLAEWELDGVLKGASSATERATDAMGSATHAVDGTTVSLRRRPAGLVGVVPAQNAAASTSLLGLTALGAGNAVMVKPPRSGPLATAWIWQELIHPQLEAVGAPLGTLSVVCATPQIVLDRWLTPDGVDCLLFVGASSRGVKLGRRCMELGIRPVLELSGNDSLMVWHDADIPAAAAAAAECFMGSAQICMVPKRIVVHPTVADAFLDALVREARTFRPGLPSQPDTMLSPVLQSVTFREVLDEALEAGAHRVAGGRTLDHTGVPDAAGAFIEPTIVRVDMSTGEAPRLRVLDEETFFPLLPVLVWRDGPDKEVLREMTAYVDDGSHGLRNSLWTGSKAVADRWLATLRNGGILKVNCSHVGFSEVLPTHGGTGLSGGAFGEANYPALTTTRLQAVQVDERHWTDQAAGPVRRRRK